MATYREEGVEHHRSAFQGGPGNTAGCEKPVFPNLYIGIAAALGAGILAYLFSRRAFGRKV